MPGNHPGSGRSWANDHCHADGEYGESSQDAAALSVFFKVAPNHKQGGADAVLGEKVSQAGQTPAQNDMPNLVRWAAG